MAWDLISFGPNQYCSPPKTLYNEGLPNVEETF
jgi:hypothetical protein